MPVSVEWDNDEQMVLRFTFVTPWTWDQFYEMHNETSILLSNVGYVVDAIVDVTQSHAIPPNALTHFSKIAGKLSPNRGVIVGIGVDAFMRSMVDMVLSQSPDLKDRLYMVKTWDEVYAIIYDAQQSREAGR